MSVSPGDLLYEPYGNFCVRFSCFMVYWVSVYPTLNSPQPSGVISDVSLGLSGRGLVSSRS